MSRTFSYYNLTGGLNTVQDLGTLNSSTNRTETPDMLNIEYYKLGGIQTMKGNTKIGNKVSGKVTCGYEYILGNNVYMIITDSLDNVYEYDKYNDTFNLITTMSYNQEEGELHDSRHSIISYDNGVVIVNGWSVLYYNKLTNTINNFIPKLQVTGGTSSSSGSTDTEDITFHPACVASLNGRLFMGANSASSTSTETYNGGMLFYSGVGLGIQDTWKAGATYEDAGAFKEFFEDTSNFTALGTWAEFIVIHKVQNTFILDVTGDTSDNWTLKHYSEYTTDSQQSYVKVNNGYYTYIKEAGGIYPLLTRSLYNNTYQGSDMSVRIKDSFDLLDTSRYNEIYATYNPRKKYILFYMPMTDNVDSEGNFNGSGDCFIMDLQTKSWLHRRVPQYVTAAFKFDDNTYIGTSDGLVLQEFKGKTFNGKPIQFHYITPPFLYGGGTNKTTTKEFRTKLVSDQTNHFYIESYRDGNHTAKTKRLIRNVGDNLSGLIWDIDYNYPTLATRKFHGKFDVNQFTLVGDVSVTADGIASNFSGSNYITKGVDLDLTKSFSFTVAYNTTENRTYNDYLLNIGSGSSGTDIVIYVVSGRTPRVDFTTSDGTSQSLYISSSIKVGIYNYIKFDWNGSTYTLSVSTDNSTWTTTTLTSSLAPDLTSPTLLTIGRAGSTRYNHSYMDLLRLLVVNNGVEIVNGDIYEGTVYIDLANCNPANFTYHYDTDGNIVYTLNEKDDTYYQYPYGDGYAYTQTPPMGLDGTETLEHNIPVYLSNTSSEIDGYSQESKYTTTSAGTASNYTRVTYTTATSYGWVQKQATELCYRYVNSTYGTYYAWINSSRTNANTNFVKSSTSTPNIIGFNGVYVSNYSSTAIVGVGYSDYQNYWNTASRYIYAYLWNNNTNTWEHTNNGVEMYIYTSAQPDGTDYNNNKGRVLCFYVNGSYLAMYGIQGRNTTHDTSTTTTVEKPSGSSALNYYKSYSTTSSGISINITGVGTQTFTRYSAGDTGTAIGTTYYYTSSSSPSVGDTAYSNTDLTTSYGSITAKTSSTITVNSTVYTRYSNADSTRQIPHYWIDTPIFATTPTIVSGTSPVYNYPLLDEDELAKSLTDSTWDYTETDIKTDQYILARPSTELAVVEGKQNGNIYEDVSLVDGSNTEYDEIPNNLRGDAWLAQGYQTKRMLLPTQYFEVIQFRFSGGYNDNNNQDANFDDNICIAGFEVDGVQLAETPMA